LVTFETNKVRRKFMQTLSGRNLEILTNEAEKREIPIQELIRAVIIPDWIESKELSWLRPKADRSLLHS